MEAYESKNIKYIEEKNLLEQQVIIIKVSSKLNTTAIVINGDLLTKINYKSILDFHELKKSELTVGVREYEYTIPYGVVETTNSKAQKIIEKPKMRYFVNAGIYVLSPQTIKKIPTNRFNKLTT